MRYLLAILFVSTAAVASEEALLKDCVSIDNKSVVVSATSAEYLKIQAFTRLAASLTAGDGVPVILLDVENLQKLPVQFQNFVYLHECAHHEFGHVTLEAMQREITTKEIELDRETIADCRSIERLVNESDYNYGRDDIQVIMDVMTKEFGAASARLDVDGKVMRRGLFKYYLSIPQRNEAMLACYSKAVKLAHPAVD